VLNVHLVCPLALIPKHAAVLSLASTSRRSALLRLPSVVAFVDLATCPLPPPCREQGLHLLQKDN
jgi:hypothetical protein